MLYHIHISVLYTRAHIVLYLYTIHYNACMTYTSYTIIYYILQVKSKVELVTRIISLETSCTLAEKAEEALKNNVYPNAKDNYIQINKLLPDIINIQLLLCNIEKTIQMSIVKQKTHDANQAMKAFKYRYSICIAYIMCVQCIQ